MGKSKLFHLMGRRSKNLKTQTQSKLSLISQKITKVKQLESDLNYNIEETIDVGIVQSVQLVQLKSKLREKMIQQKEIIENQIEFFTTEQIHLQNEVARYDLKIKKISERLKEINESDARLLELKRLDKELIFKKK